MRIDLALISGFLKKNKKIILRSGIILFVLFFLIFTDYGFLKTINLMIDRSELNNNIIDQKIIRDSLNRRITKLTKDSFEIERIAREHYGLIKPGEMIYISSEK